MNCSPSSSIPAPAVFQALNEKDGTKIPSPIVNSSLSRSDESTIVYTEDLSMTTCRGSIVDLAEADTVLQTPNRPEECYSSDQEYENKIATSAVAYRTRSKDKDQNKPRMILGRLRNELENDLENDKLRIEIFDKSKQDESGVY